MNLSRNSSDFDRLQQAVKVIDEIILNPGQGLTDDLFYLVSRLTPLINVDLLVVNSNDEKLMSWRSDSHYGPGWHIPGGIVRFKEKWEDRIRLVAQQELGIQVKCNDEPILITQIFSKTRDVRGHFISMLFQCTPTEDLDRLKFASESNHAISGELFWFSKMPYNTIEQHLRFRSTFDAAKYKGISDVSK